MIAEGTIQTFAIDNGNGTNGPFPTLTSFAAVQPHRSGHWRIMQQIP